ncbi:MAG: DNA alkylation repair protein, partial [Lachnospiraceae bacterium]|nr:DNA alkylation repair protein [Lachnospiraceae bacterium]
MKQSDDLRGEICSRLKELADEEYRVFHSRLCPGTEKILGVRIPVLRAYAKKLMKAYDPQQLIAEFYTLKPGREELQKELYQRKAEQKEPEQKAFYREELYYEEKVLTGMLLGLWKAPSPQAFEAMLERFLPLIDNWAVCDITCGGLKYIKKEKEFFYPVWKRYLKSKNAYTVRFGVVLLMDYYMEETYYRELCQLYEQIEHEDYYVKMAVAWAYSVLLVKFYEPVSLFLTTCKLDTFTFRKTIQKACESKRLCAEQKKELRKLKEQRMMQDKAPQSIMQQDKTQQDRM